MNIKKYIPFWGTVAILCIVFTLITLMFWQTLFQLKLLFSSILLLLICLALDN